MPDLHTLNILTHIATGSAAILVGLFVLARRKGDKAHRTAGWLTLSFAIACVTTALIGAFVFRGKIDLMGASIVISYNLWAGVRALKLENNGRNLKDLGPAVVIFTSGIGLLTLSQVEGLLNWPPVLVYSISGALLTYGTWDMVRTLLPIHWRRFLNPAEHAFRMAGLIAALSSVAAATLFPSPYVALGVSGAGLLVSLVFAVRAARNAPRYTLGVTPSHALNARLKADSEL